MNVENPFLIRGYAGAEYFCDREQETAQMLAALTNGRDVTLMSPRRYGKTGLIQNVFGQLPSSYRTVYVDIFATQALSDFTRLFATSVVGALDTNVQRAMSWVAKAFKSCRPTVTPQESGLPKFSFDIVEANAEVTLKEAFDYLRVRDRKVVIALDEFQQILEYPEKGTEALLRSLIQFLPNVHFVFAGSRHHLMRDMFMTPRHPFYQSSDILSLPVIDRTRYAVFARRFFNGAGKPFEDDVFGAIYDRFEGVTWYVQMVLNRLWQMGGGVTDCSQVDEAVRMIVGIRDFEYADLLASQSVAARRLLLALAAERAVAEPQSGGFIARAHLGSASTVRSALKSLETKDLVYRTPSGYIVYDRFFGEWLAARNSIVP